MTELLKFSKGSGHAKLKALGKAVYTFSIPSGHTCPGADVCLAKAVFENQTWHLEDGPKKQFRCFSASQEVAFPAVRRQRQFNFDLLDKTTSIEEMYELIMTSLPVDASVIRVHVAGDFYSLAYMKAWCLVAKALPDVTFYAYTKSLNFWVRLIEKGEIPKNFILNASKGGKYDKLIDKHNLKYAEVVFSEQAAIDKGLEIDHDDSHAFLQDKSFALLIHGVQPKNSLASEAVKKLKGLGSYGKKGLSLQKQQDGKTNKNTTPR